MKYEYECKTEEEKEYLRLINMGRRHTAESIEKIREKAIGRKHSLETKQKMRLINIATTERLKKPIECSNGLIFSYSGEAQEWLRANGFPTAQKTNIVSCCTGKLKTAYGYVWRYHKMQ